MELPVTVRATTSADRDVVLDLVQTAFSDDTRTGDEEVDIVIRTWACGATAHPIDLVAVDDDTIAGHVLGAAGTLDDHELLAVAPLAVAPLAVAPAHQGCGVGTALMTELLTRAEGAGWPMVVLLGRPEYYSRFGFEPASRFGITYAAVGAGNPHFQARRLRAFTDVGPGIFTYCWEQPSLKSGPLPLNAGSACAQLVFRVSCRWAR